jgi:hypothetical protein
VQLDERSARKRLIALIDAQDWHALTEPKAFRAFAYLLLNTESETLLVDELIAEVNFAVLRFFALWSLAGFSDYISVWSLPLAAAVLLGQHERPYAWQSGVAVLLGAAALWYTRNTLYCSAALSFGRILLFNAVSLRLLRACSNKLRKLLGFAALRRDVELSRDERNKDTGQARWRRTVLFLLYISTLLCFVDYSRGFIVLQALYSSVTDVWQLLWFVILYAVGAFSNYKALHVFSLALSIAVSHLLYVYSKRPRSTAPKTKMHAHARVIEDYLQ